jgi:predicted nucleic acid-binding protein
MRVIVFDTQALLAFYLGEPGSNKVEDYLTGVLDKKIKGHMNIVNLAELYYVLCRVGRNVAEEKERNLKSFGVKIVSIRDKSKLWKKAALIKAEHAVSLADAFAAATAIFLKGTLITGADLEFSKIENLKIERV